MVEGNTGSAPAATEAAAAQGNQGGVQINWNGTNTVVNGQGEAVRLTGNAVEGVPTTGAPTAIKPAPATEAPAPIEPGLTATPIELPLQTEAPAISIPESAMEGDSIAVSFDGPSQVVSNGQAVKNITTPAREGAPTTANPAPAETAENTEPAQATAEQALQTTTRSPERQAKLDAAAAAAREESAASTEPAPRQPQATAEMQDGERVNGEGAAKVDQAELPSEVTGPKDENTVSSKKGAIDQGMGNQETGDDFGVVADPASIDQ